MAAKIELYEANDGWRFRIKSGNGEIVAVGEAYSSRDAALRGVEAVGRAVEEALASENIVDAT